MWELNELLYTMTPQLNNLQSQIDELKAQVTSLQKPQGDSGIQTHAHNGLDSQRINLFDVFGTLQTTSVIPTGIPQAFFDQFKIYSNSTTYRIYIYDTVNAVWRYGTLT